MSAASKILVVFDTAGPVSADQDFSEELKSDDWRTEADVLKAVRKLEYPFEYLGIYDDLSLLQDKIRSYRPDIIFNLVESFHGRLHHDRDIASFLKLMQIPFTGCGPTGLTLCKNKGLSKEILSFHRIRVPDFQILLRRKTIHRLKRLDFPILIKPLSEEASYGISQASFVENDEQFRERVRFIHEQLDQDAIAEEYIEGRELYVSVIGNERLEVLPLRELVFGEVPEEEPKIATFKAKWDEAYRKRWGIRNQFAGPLAAGIKEKIEKLSKKVYRLLSISGYARLDLRLTPAGDIVFIEANPNPILAEWEDFGQSGMKSGLTYPQLIDRIIRLSHPHTED